jgi:hypothetical protein
MPAQRNAAYSVDVLQHLSTCTSAIAATRPSVMRRNRELSRNRVAQPLRVARIERDRVVEHLGSRSIAALTRVLGPMVLSNFPTSARRARTRPISTPILPTARRECKRYSLSCWSWVAPWRWAPISVAWKWRRGTARRSNGRALALRVGSGEPGYSQAHHHRFGEPSPRAHAPEALRETRELRLVGIEG